MEGPTRIRIQLLSPCGAKQNLNPVSERGAQSSLNSDSLVPCSFPWPALALVKLHSVEDCSTIQLTKISLQGLSFLKGVNSSSQLSVIGKLTHMPSSFVFKSPMTETTFSFLQFCFGIQLRPDHKSSPRGNLSHITPVASDNHSFFSTIPIRLRIFKWQPWMASIVEGLEWSVSEVI